MNKTHSNIQESSDTLRRFTKPSHQIQETFNPAVIPKNKQNLQPTRLAKVAVILQPESLFLFCWCFEVETYTRLLFQLLLCILKKTF